MTTRLFEEEVSGRASRRTIRALHLRLEKLEAQRQEFLKQGDDMVSMFRRRYPDAPAYLVRYSDRTHNDYRWRLSSAKRLRGDRPKGLNRSFDLTNETGRALLAQMPEEMRRMCLSLENSRVSLNFQSAMVNYERFRVKDLIERKEALRQLLIKYPAGNRA